MVPKKYNPSVINLILLTIHQNQAFPDAAFRKAGRNFRGDVDKCPPGGNLKKKFFAKGFHIFSRGFK